MNPNQDDKTTTRHMIITFIAFGVLCVLLIIGANLVVGTWGLVRWRRLERTVGQNAAAMGNIESHA